MMKNRPKLSDDLVQNLQHVHVEDQIPIIVRYTPERQILRHKGPAMRGVRESYNYRLEPMAHMHATPEAIEALEEDPEIVRIYQDLPVYALLDTALPIVHAPQVWESGYDGQGVSIAIVDTGIDPTHPDFQGRIAGMADLVGEGPIDENGHGTHCAGIAAGSGAASEGTYRGIAPGATLYSAKVLRRNGQGMMSDVMAGIDWAVEQGVQIISLSLGGPGPGDGRDALSDICDAAVASGVIVCAAAGNEGPGSHTIGSPGAARRVITVGASTDQETIAAFSSRGPTADNRSKPDIVMPGHHIMAPRGAGTSMGAPQDECYTEASGTSMATPMAAGLCALLLQKEPLLTPDEIKERLMQTAVDLGESAYAQGLGRADAWRAVNNLISQRPEPPDVPEPVPDKSPSLGLGCLMALVQLLLSGRK